MKTKDRIVQASLELFNQQGERNVTTNHIAAHLNMSPGNLYYHFRNKEDIIRSIFQEYRAHLEANIQPYEAQQVDLALLTSYFDSIFNLMWRFRFLYANMVDILNRDAKLQSEYIEVQSQVLDRIVLIFNQLHQEGLLTLSQSQLPILADTIKLTVSCWISYRLSQSSETEITQPQVYEGLQRVLMVFKAYASPAAQADIEALQRHYAVKTLMPA
ncbi:TetR/AcrR family transcriptional regulator [Paraferrimonas sedimenticola]|uniref:TetR family transcriptional regulator n=1 Tax=Paraferrimonas sedimenticola TaxID=375674 RepID=A0AA37RYJ8_9GAMM|nr:TetR/AcrR family transcriptional regulator [Paraferrimonas sedimenticola]GLP97531.1 TetR family transcriptional regulator [Paraferrimonas sedimenticola]